MIATTIEQSKHLLELGLDPKTADMVWVRYAAGGYRLEVLHRELFERIMETDIAAWSLSALLEVMPSFIDYKGQKLRLTIEKAGIWNVFYLGTKHRINEIWFNGEYGNPVEPAYKMVCWLLEQGLTKKRENYESKN